MQTIGLVIGILALIGFFVGLMPCLGALNWLNIPFAFVGLIINIIAVAQPTDKKGMAIGGIILCAIAIVIGGVRLLLGGGLV